MRYIRDMRDIRHVLPDCCHVHIMSTSWSMGLVDLGLLCLKTVQSNNQLMALKGLVFGSKEHSFAPAWGPCVAQLHTGGVCRGNLGIAALALRMHLEDVEEHCARDSPEKNLCLESMLNLE